MRKIYFLCLFIGTASLVYAQPSLSKMKDALGKGQIKTRSKFNSVDSTLASIVFRGSDVIISKTEVKGWLQNNLSLRVDKDELKERSDEVKYFNDIEIHKFQQYYKGIKVEHGVITVLSKKGKVENIQLEFFPVDENIAISPSISEQEALKKATIFIGAQKYDWEDYTGDDPEFQAPKGEVVFVQDYFKHSASVRLSYKFKIFAQQPLSQSYVYVDAVNGGILLVDRITKHLNGGNINKQLESQEALHNQAGIAGQAFFNQVAGTADTRYSGTQNIQADFTGTNYRLRQLHNGDSIVTLNYNRLVRSGANNALATDFTDNDNNWTTAEHAFNYDDAAHDVHFAMQIISDYWQTIHLRNSWNNAHGAMKSYVHVRDVSAPAAGLNNAFWSVNSMYYGDGSYYSTSGNGAVANVNGFKPLTALDVSAHELGHAVCQTTAQLVYERESGGMNEGFSDIWAACVENFSGLPKNPWLIAEELVPSTGALRSMQNPKLFGNPDTYGGQYWSTVTLHGCPLPDFNYNDYCGVHGNSGVLNKWFYLLTQGGSGTNDLGKKYSVTGLGFASSEQIAYLTELSLTPDATFATARQAAIDGASALFGDCSNEVIQVMNAWHAVGVGEISNCTPTAEFVTTVSSVSEGNGVGGNCGATKTLLIPFKLAGIASQQTDIAFSVSGTAIQGIDYSITPSSLSYNAGDSGVQNLTITINDDGTSEGNETIILNYTVNANGGNAIAGINNKDSIIITDDDNNLALPVKSGITYTTLVNENFDAAASGATFPAGWTSNLSYQGSTNTNRWGVGTMGGAGITGKAGYITNNPTAPDPPFVYTTNATTVSIAANRILRLPVLNTTGLSDIKISFKYKSEGESDASSIYDGADILYDPTGSGVQFNHLIDPSINDNFVLYGNGNNVMNFPPTAFPSSMNNKSSVHVAFRWWNDDFAGSGIPLLVDEVLVTGRSMGTAVETQAAQASNGFKLVAGSGSSNLLSAVDSQVIAKVRNLNQDISCLNAQLLQAGNGQVPVTTDNGSYMRTQKVIQLSPAVANTTATYEGSLYFTTAELATWGTDDVNLKILKVKDGTNLGSVLTPSTAELITPTSVTKDATNGIITYVGNFTGFSQFMLASPNIALPVELITFEARPVNRSVTLNWSTAQEINNKGFGIERSADGVNYSNIGWMNGKGNTSMQSDYTYTDNFVQPGAIYYYRLRQTDLDLREKYSVIRQARLEKAGMIVSLTPNPAKGKVALYISGNRALADINLVDAQGQTVRSWQKLNASDVPATLDINGLAAGIYLVRIQLPGENRTEKLVIK